VQPILTKIEMCFLALMQLLVFKTGATYLLVFLDVPHKKLVARNFRVALKRQFAAFDSLVVCTFCRQTEMP
jgi:hypothetical protein